ncbi:hypothetical protein [Croceitalea dokdonensis]|nr:hypothetical protein [Croceitalea dokdonensis]
MMRFIFFLALSLAIACSSKATEDNLIEMEPRGPEGTVDEDGNGSSAQNSDPLFTNSIVSTEIDFIRSGDSDSFLSITYEGQAEKEMPDSRNDQLFDTAAFVFKANFSAGVTVEIWAHSSFGNENVAKENADKIVNRLGKLPPFMLNKLSHVVLHKGDAGAFAESESNFFVVYSENIDVRISNKDLEETVFHESVHATLDAVHLQRAEWRDAQQRDGTFITQYAMENADKEDMAETALFVYTMVKHPGRLAPDTEAWVRTNIPNRYNFLKTIFE